ncbi:MAG: YifB family Mg chelatase-like AAA ATPase [Planctomycetota bacterium]
MARLCSADVFGIDGRIVEIEVALFPTTQPTIVISGLPGKGIRESRERIRSAIQNSRYFFPGDKKVIVNLAPAAWEKDGAVFDLPIALGILLASKELEIAHDSLAAWGVLGELSLDGRLRPAVGTLAMVAALRDVGRARIVVPVENLDEAAAVPGVVTRGAVSLRQAADILRGTDPGCAAAPVATSDSMHQNTLLPALDFHEVVGHRAIKRALAIAVAGEHNVLFVGPPGAGKSLMARRISGLLPPPTDEERLEITRIHSAAGLKQVPGLITERPFRAPHHTVSWAGLVGGGIIPRPGEITAAHRGVLFLDELPEFQRRSLEALREPLEEGQITISRAAGSLRFPASFLLVAAMNPCPCGYYMHPRRRCGCLGERIRRYLEKVSGPLLDRIDLRIEVAAPSSGEMLAAAGARDPIGSAALRAIVDRAVEFRRREGRPQPNRFLEWTTRREWAPMATTAERLLARSATELDLSTRGLTRVLRLARTIADTEAERSIADRHLHEALEYRTPRGGAGMFSTLGG